MYFIFRAEKTAFLWEAAFSLHTMGLCVIMKVQIMTEARKKKVETDETILLRRLQYLRV